MRARDDLESDAAQLGLEPELLDPTLPFAAREPIGNPRDNGDPLAKPRQPALACESCLEHRTASQVARVAGEQHQTTGAHDAGHLLHGRPPVPDVLEYLARDNGVERVTTEAPLELERVALQELASETELGGALACAVDAEHVDTHELEPIGQRCERLPEVERRRPGAADIENTYASSVTEPRGEIECQPELGRIPADAIEVETARLQLAQDGEGGGPGRPKACRAVIRVV